MVGYRLSSLIYPGRAALGFDSGSPIACPQARNLRIVKLRARQDGPISELRVESWAPSMGPYLLGGDLKYGLLFRRWFVQ